MVQLKDSYKNQLIAIIHKHLPRCKIFLFGSFAINTQTQSSDIDLALDAKKAIHYKTLLRIQLDIDETTIPFSIDLVDLHTANDAIKKNILSEGIEWTK